MTDSGNQRVQVFDRGGAFLGKWGSAGNGDGQFNGPAGIVVHGHEVYVADRFNSRIQVFDRRGVFLRKWGHSGAGDGEFAANGPNDGPVGVAVHGNVIYVTDFGNNRVQVFDRTGGFRRKFGSVGSEPGEFQNPVGVAVHGDEVYVADRNNNRVQVFRRGSP